MLQDEGPTRVVGAEHHTATGCRQLNSLVLREALLIDIEVATPRQAVEDEVSVRRPERRERGLIRRVEGQCGNGGADSGIMRRRLGRKADAMENRMSHSANRRILLASAAAAGLSLALPAWAGLLRTPSQALGPFYPRQLPLDNDNDLVSVAGRSGSARGEICNLHGRILDEAGQPVGAARVEIWQCDAFGRYHHPDDRGDRPLDPGFQGYGRFTTGVDGGYRFRTIKPVPYPGRAPHVHFAITVAGQAPLVTQMYVAGAAENAGDGLLQGVRDPQARAALLATFVRPADGGDLLARFDIVLGPATPGGR